jgi:hypothetical protein
MAWYTGRLSKVFVMPIERTVADLMEDDSVPSYEEGDENLLTTSSAEHSKTVADLQHWHKTMGFKWWYQHPKIQAEMRDSGSMDGVTAEILKQNQVSVLNRGMNTRVVLPNGD